MCQLMPNTIKYLRVLRRITYFNIMTIFTAYSRGCYENENNLLFAADNKNISKAIVVLYVVLILKK